MPHDVKQGAQHTLQWQLGTDVSAASEVRLRAATEPSVTPVIDRAITVDGTDGTLVYTTITAAETGTVQNLLVEIIATWPNGDVVKFPPIGYELLRIREDLT